MEVILLERIEKLGQMGDVVNVRPGFARNYLLPQKKALRATAENRNYFETQRAQLETTNLELKKEADGISQKLDGLSVTIVRQASDNDQLYGSVTVRNIAQAITEAGFTIDSKQVQMARPIKSVGMHEIIVRLHPEVGVKITVNVARSEEEAINQVEEQSHEMAEKLESVTEENIEKKTTSHEEETLTPSTEEASTTSE